MKLSHLGVKYTFKLFAKASNRNHQAWRTSQERCENVISQRFSQRCGDVLWSLQISVLTTL